MTQLAGTEPRINWSDTAFMAGVALVVCVLVLAVFPSLRSRATPTHTPEPTQ